MGASAKANLVHRYSFGEAPGSTTVKDSVGTADGALVGTGDFTGDGKLNLTGVDGYVDLPNGIISSLTNATFETWITWNSARTWERIFDLGSSTGGEDVSGHRRDLSLPHSPGRQRSRPFRDHRQLWRWGDAGVEWRPPPCPRTSRRIWW